MFILQRIPSRMEKIMLIYEEQRTNLSPTTPTVFPGYSPTKFTGSPTCASFWNFLPARPRGPLCPFTAQRLEVQPRPRVGVFMLPPGPRAHGALLDLRGLWVPYTRPCDRGRLPRLMSREPSGADPSPSPRCSVAL